MFVCILDAGGNVRIHQNIHTDQEAFLHTIAPFREDIVVAVDPIDRHGTITRRNKEEFEYGYRYTKGLKDNEWFVAAYFQLEPGDGKASLEKIKAFLDRRAETQPTGEPSCGSTFRNPEGDYAARLIEACGLKGFRIGDMEVSPKHANFLINTGNGTAKDALALVTGGWGGRSHRRDTRRRPSSAATTATPPCWSAHVHSNWSIHCWRENIDCSRGLKSYTNSTFRMVSALPIGLVVLTYLCTLRALALGRLNLI
jgi:hypothetical protein